MEFPYLRPSGIVSVVGAGMRYTPGVAGRVFTALGKARVNVIAIAQGFIRGVDQPGCFTGEFERMPSKHYMILFVSDQVGN